MDAKSLSRCRLFFPLSPEEIETVFAEISFSEAAYHKGDILAMQAETCNRLIILTKGSVKTEMSDPSGKIVKVEDIDAPQILAPLFLFGMNNRFPVQVTACEPTEAVVLPKQSVLELFSKNQQILKNYLDISANFAKVLSDKLYFISFRTIRQKLASYILKLSDGKDLLRFDRSQNSLAEYFGVSRPALARELYNMQEDKLILVDKKNVEILDRNQLIHLIKFS